MAKATTHVGHVSLVETVRREAGDVVPVGVKCVVVPEHGSSSCELGSGLDFVVQMKEAGRSVCSSGTGGNVQGNEQLVKRWTIIPR